MKNLKPCPICKRETAYQNPRYPNMVCEECDSKATDEFGRKLEFSNVGLSGGYQAHYLDNGEKYDSHVCYINGVECRANEAKFGGIVIEVWNKTLHSK